MGEPSATRITNSIRTQSSFSPMARDHFGSRLRLDAQEGGEFLRRIRKRPLDAGGEFPSGRDSAKQQATWPQD